MSKQPITRAQIKPPPGAAVSSPPPKATRSRLRLELPSPAAVPDNLTIPSDDITDLNFKVPNSFHRRFKTEAAIRGVSMKELLEMAFKAFVEQHGEQSSKGLL